jgi:hypothetical protein
VQRIPEGSTVLFYPYQEATHVQGMLAQADAGPGFKIYGGYAYVPGEGGFSTLLPPTLKPLALQNLFIDAFYGTQIGRPPLGAGTSAAIRTLLVRYGIGTLVVEPVGVDPALAVRFLTMAIGQPEEIGGATVWFNAATRASHAQPR